MKNGSEPLVSIIILNYNAGNLLLECIESVSKTNYDNFEIIVVDNASKDDSVNQCKEKFQEIQIILLLNPRFQRLGQFIEGKLIPMLFHYRLDFIHLFLDLILLSSLLVFSDAA